MWYRKFKNPWVLSFVLALLLVAAYEYSFGTPSSFVPDSIVQIEAGSSASEIAVTLTTAHIIRHPRLFLGVLKVSGKSADLQSGVYKFSTPPTLFATIHRLLKGEYDLPVVRLTFVEGATIRDIGAQVHTALPAISEAEVLSAASGKEGYLFPDTYFFSPATDAQDIVSEMRANFDTKMAPLAEAVTVSNHSTTTILIMASLIEKEARTPEDRHMISGILWNRLALSMPLQVDAVFGYIFNRDTYSPSYADLKIDSPYNTYTHIGLPPGPIDNPGMEAIDAALHPTSTKYLYYLTDKEGVMHYATTYAAHQANLRKYLK